MKIIVQITIIILGICHFATAQFSGDIDTKFNPQDLGFGQGEGFTRPGKLFIVGMDGKVVFENGNFMLGENVDIQKLPNGVFKVLFQNEEGELNTTFHKE
jgi:hypothetical protein